MMLLLLMMLATGAAKPAACSGYYVTPREADGFSVKVESSVLEIVYMDYSPRDLMRYTRNRDGSLTFHIENGAPSTLRCDSTGATIEIAASTVFLHNPETAIRTPARRVRLVHFGGDIFKYAAKRGWAVGD